MPSSDQLTRRTNKGKMREREREKDRAREMGG